MLIKGEIKCGVRRNSVLSSQLLYKPKIILRKKVCLLKTQKALMHRNDRQSLTPPLRLHLQSLNQYTHWPSYRYYKLPGSHASLDELFFLLECSWYSQLILLLPSIPGSNLFSMGSVLIALFNILTHPQTVRLLASLDFLSIALIF